MEPVFNLVVGLAGPHGSGCTTLAEEITAAVNDWPGCKAFHVKVSRVIDRWAVDLLDLKSPAQDAAPARRRQLQNAGTKLRQVERNLVGKLVSTEILDLASGLELHPPKKPPTTLVFVVDSLKNRNDIDALRRIYKDEFLVAFVSADRETRWHRIKEYKAWSERQRALFDQLDSVDRDEKAERPSVEDAGQETGTLAPLADYFVVNNRNRQDLQAASRRIVSLLLGGVENSQPTADEQRMHLAFSASNGSGCLSRQVGAALFNPRGEIIGLGHNDVPKAGGGLYSVEDQSQDHRCYLVGDSRCTNETLKAQRFDQLTERLCKVIRTKRKASVRKVIGESELKSATEFCRAVHAEMSALLGAARSGCVSTVGSTMYVTTYPCHNCAKHILCAGVKRVVYVEPYPKSLAADLHSDGLDVDALPNEQTTRTCLQPYAGVAPRRFHDFFTQEGERKDSNGRAIRISRETRAGRPRFSTRVRPRTRDIENASDEITFSEYAVLHDINRRAKAGNLGKKSTSSGMTGRSGRNQGSKPNSKKDSHV